MIFPFTISYTKVLKENIEPSDIDSVLNYVSDFILYEGGEKVHIDKNQLIFKSSFFKFRLNTHIFKNIEKGKFTLSNTENGLLLTYELFMYRMILIFLAFAIFGGYHSQSIENGIYGFACVFGISWIITFIRHKLMFNEIISGINKLNTIKNNSTHSSPSASL